MPRFSGYVPWNDTERDAILSAIPPEKRTPQTIQFLESVVKRIRPLSPDADGTGRAVYFTSPDHHLDRDALLHAPTALHPNARSMKCRNKRLFLHDRLLHTGLYNIFCAVGSEWAKESPLVLAHIAQYPPDSTEHQGGGEAVVGRTCTCSNPTHVVLATKSTNLTHQYAYEGRARPYSETNFNSQTSNEEVDSFRDACWARAYGAASLAATPLNVRLSWKPDDPRFRGLKAWAKRRSSTRYMESWQTMLGIRSRRTMMNYLFNRNHVVRHRSNARRDFPRGKVLREEKRLVARLLDAHVPDAMKTPMENVAFLERVVGAPATNKDTRSRSLFTVLIRAVRRRLNERFKHPAGARYCWITERNVAEVVAAIPSIEERLVTEVKVFVRDGLSRPSSSPPQYQRIGGILRDCSEFV